MRVGLVGFGRAGKAVATILLQSKDTNLQWVLRKSKTLEHRSVPEFLGIQSDEPGLIYPISEFNAYELLEKHPVDIIVDFSCKNGLDYYGEEARRRGITIISAISEYSAEAIDYLHSVSEQTLVLYSPNITLGVNFLMISARILRNIAPDVDIEIIEEHFKGKQEVSGTAKKIAGVLGLPDSSIKTVRAGGIIGVHEVLFGFPFQTVRLKHESISREAFGNGILFAIENLPEQKSGFLTMEDLLLPYFNLDKTEQDYVNAGTSPWWRVR